MTLAQGQGLKLSDMPKPMNDMEKKAMAADKAIMEELQALKGEPFDSCYMSGQVGDHDTTLGKLMAGQQAFTEQRRAHLAAGRDDAARRPSTASRPTRCSASWARA